MEVSSKLKLTQAERETIIQMYNDRIPIVHIAEQFKVSKRGPFYSEKK